MEVVTAGAQDELMQSLDYKLKTSNTSYVTARHDVQYFPSSLSSFSPTTCRVCRIPLTSGTSFIDPESIAFRVRNTDGTNPLAPATPNPACFVQRVQVFANGQRCDDINYYGRTVAVHDLLKGREYNRNKAMEGFDEVNDPRVARAVHQGGYADVLLRPTVVGILRCGKMLPPQRNLAIEIEFADATTALWSENAGAHPSGATLSTNFEIQNVRVLASQVVLDSALVESFNRVLLSGRSLVFSYPTVHTQQSSVPNGVAEHNVTVARAFTKLMGAFVTFWDNDAGSKIHLLAKVASLSARRPRPRSARYRYVDQVLIVLVSEEGLPQLGEPVLAVALQRPHELLLPVAQENVVVGPLADEGLVVVKVLGGGAQPQVRVVVLPRSGQLPVRVREQRVGAPLCRFNTTEPSAVVRPLAPISAASLMCCRRGSWRVAGDAGVVGDAAPT